jgi:hypothetical protein
VDKIGGKNCFSPKSKIEKVIVLYLASIATSLEKLFGKKSQFEIRNSFNVSETEK